MIKKIYESEDKILKVVEKLEKGEIFNLKHAGKSEYGDLTTKNRQR